MFTLAKKSVALAAAGASVYVTYKRGVWSDAEQSKRAWEDLRETLSNSSTSPSSRPVSSALQVSLWVSNAVTVFVVIVRTSSNVYGSLLRLA